MIFYVYYLSNLSNPQLYLKNGHHDLNTWQNYNFFLSKEINAQIYF